MNTNTPIIVDLEPGTYYWCSCGKSKTPGFCDGSHKGPDMQPVQFVISEKKQVALCNCKHSKASPFCDGAHVKHELS